MLKVCFLPDDLRGCGIGLDGGVWTAKDGGAQWKAQNNESGYDLRSVAVNKDGRRAWGVGKAGTILFTNNGGDNWSPQSSNVADYLQNVRFDEDGNKGWAVGAAGTVLKTTNGGDSWENVSLYRQRPGLLLPAESRPGPRGSRLPAQGPASRGQDSIASIYISDAALTADEASGKRIGAVAAGLASYLQNPRTRAPLVIGITGPWGSGKSSLMGILRDLLRRRGFQTVWFNAWHH